MALLASATGACSGDDPKPASANEAVAKAAKILKDAGSVRYTILVPADDGGSRATILSAKGAVTWSPTGVRSATGEFAAPSEWDSDEPKAPAIVIGPKSWTKDFAVTSESDGELTLDPKWTLLDTRKLIEATGGAIAASTRVGSPQDYLDVLFDPGAEWSDGGAGTLDGRGVHFYDATFTNTDLVRAALREGGVAADAVATAFVLEEFGMSAMTKLRLVVDGNGTPVELRISQSVDIETLATEQLAQLAARALTATGLCPPSTSSTSEPANQSTTPDPPGVDAMPDTSRYDYVVVTQLHDLGAPVTIEAPPNSEVEDRTSAAAQEAIEAKKLADQVATCRGTTAASVSSN